MSVQKSFYSAKYVCIRAEAVWKLIAGGNSWGEAKDLEVILRGTDADSKHFIYFCSAAAQ